MVKKTSGYNDEIDLLKLFYFLWDGKWIIITFLFLGLGIGFYLSSNKNPSYESKIIYSIETLPPFYTEDKAITDFQYFFYSQNIFNNWKKNYPSDLKFDFFSKEKIINGLKYSKEDEEQLAKLLISEDDPIIFYLLVKTNDTNLLNDFFNYFNYISDKITSEYFQTAKEELNLIDSRLQELTNVDIDFDLSLEELDRLSVDDLIKFNIRDKLLTLDDGLIKNVLAVNRFIVAVDNGKKIYKIEPPTYPKTILPNSGPIIFISLLLGFFIGVLITFILKAIPNK